jgi:hypothetical protein
LKQGFNLAKPSAPEEIRKCSKALDLFSFVAKQFVGFRPVGCRVPPVRPESADNTSWQAFRRSASDLRIMPGNRELLQFDAFFATIMLHKRQ